MFHWFSFSLRWFGYSWRSSAFSVLSCGKTARSSDIAAKKDRSRHPLRVGGSDARAVCPPLVEQNTADQTRAAIELEALPKGAMVVRMLSDYAVLRDQARTCR
jgi:hypothetical protein